MYTLPTYLPTMKEKTVYHGIEVLEDTAEDFRGQ
jgi:hypothetical protein